MLAEITWTIDKLAVALGCAIPLTWIIGYFWYKAMVTRSEHDLKRRLAERGMSVDEIERVKPVRRRFEQIRDLVRHRRSREPPPAPLDGSG